MKELTWDKSLSVQIEEIDEDHRRLVELFNILCRAVDEGDAQNYIEAVLEELIWCTVWHFSHEERLMVKYAYSGYAEHRKEHQELIASARELQNSFLEKHALSEDDIMFLEQWLTGHILSTDMDLGSFLEETM